MLFHYLSTILVAVTFFKWRPISSFALSKRKTA